VRVSALEQSVARWSHDIQVDPDSEYELTGWVKTADVQGSGARIGVYGHGVATDSYLAASTDAVLDTQEWTPVSVRFVTGRTRTVRVACTLGESEPLRASSTASGTMWCDDLGLTKLRTLDLAYLAGRYVALHLYAEDWHFQDAAQYVAYLDEVYEILADLVGGTPYGGERITVRSDASMHYALLSGSTIRVRPGLPLAQTVNEHGIDFGVVHELGHDFDLAASGHYIGAMAFHDYEHWADLKALHVFDVLGVRHPHLTGIALDGRTLPLSELGLPYVERLAVPWLAAESRDYRAMPHDVYTGLTYMLRPQLGWGPFACAFRAYAQRASAPEPATDEAKVSLWASTLSRCAGADLIPIFQSWGLPATMVAS
jgi:hypothetical protein